MNQLDIDWLQRRKDAHPEEFINRRVLEIGSLDVNGNVRDLFHNTSFVGVDWKEGKNVEVVSLAHETHFEERFNTLLSMNHLEHDPYWEKSLDHNLQYLSPGALLYIRWGTEKSQRHGDEFDPSHTGYHPKTMQQVKDFLEKNGIKIFDAVEEHNPYIGVMGGIIARI